MEQKRQRKRGYRTGTEETEETEETRIFVAENLLDDKIGAFLKFKTMPIDNLVLFLSKKIESLDSEKYLKYRDTFFSEEFYNKNSSGFTTVANIEQTSYEIQIPSEYHKILQYNQITLRCTFGLRNHSIHVRLLPFKKSQMFLSNKELYINDNSLYPTKVSEECKEIGIEKMTLCKISGMGWSDYYLNTCFYDQDFNVGFYSINLSGNYKSRKLDNIDNQLIDSNFYDQDQNCFEWFFYINSFCFKICVLQNRYLNAEYKSELTIECSQNISFSKFKDIMEVLYSYYNYQILQNNYQIHPVLPPEMDNFKNSQEFKWLSPVQKLYFNTKILNFRTKIDIFYNDPAYSLSNIEDFFQFIGLQRFYTRVKQLGGDLSKILVKIPKKNIL